jgi:hypothetical protein
MKSLQIVNQCHNSFAHDETMMPTVTNIQRDVDVSRWSSGKLNGRKNLLVWCDGSKNC